MQDAERTNERERAVVLVSGGMDSLVTTAIAREAYDIALMHMNYGQLTEARELASFTRIADHYGVTRRLVIEGDFLKQIGGSALTDPVIALPRGDINRVGIPTSYVPFRNSIILSIAVSWAETIGATKLFIGAVEEDSSGYPDCREVYYRAFNALIKEGTKPETGIEVVTPLIHLKKEEIVARGTSLAAPFELSWSCYRDNEIACGECDSCLLRLKGFAKAGIDDPIPYRRR